MRVEASAALRCLPAIRGLAVAAGLVRTGAAFANQTLPPQALPIPVCMPVGLAVNSKNELFVANHYSSGASCNGGQVVVYDSLGKQLTKRTITANLVNPQDWRSMLLAISMSST